MPRITVEHDVDIYDVLNRIDDSDLLEELRNRCIGLDEYDDDELVTEMKTRGLTVSDRAEEFIRAIYYKRRLGKDYESELDQLLYHVTGMAI